MNLEKFTDRAKGFLQAAQTIAIRMNHQRIAPEHIAKALLEDSEGMAAGLIAKSGGDAPRAVAGIDALLAKLPAVSGSGAQATPGLDNDAVRLLDQAEQVATKAGDGYVTVERLLLAMVVAPTTPVGKAFADAGLTAEALNAAINDLRGGRSADTASSEDRYEALKKFARDLTEVARAGKLDPVIGRDEEIRRTIQILARRTKNNPRADRRARGRQDRDRRGARAAHHQRRRPRQFEGSPPAVARHGGADRGCQISRRV